MMRSNIIVTGANGQLGNEFRDIQQQFPEFVFHFFDKQEMDITDDNQVRSIIKNVRPGFVINCAAYTAVDKAESEYEKALRINQDGAGILAAACVQSDSKFIHISTDYVF